MTYTKTDYYAEGLSQSFDEHGVSATQEQIEAIADDLLVSIEHQGMAFYEPSWGDRISDIEGEWKKKYSELQKEFDAYRGNAEKAVKRALRQYDDSNVSIGSHGEVYRHDGRTTQIQ